MSLCLMGNVASLSAAVARHNRSMPANSPRRETDSKCPHTGLCVEKDAKIDIGVKILYKEAIGKYKKTGESAAH